MYKIFLLFFLFIPIVLVNGGDINKTLEQMQQKQEYGRARGFFLHQKLMSPDSLFANKEIKKEDNKKAEPLLSLSEIRRDRPTLSLPSSISNSFISYRDYYKEKSELEAKIIRLEMNVEKLVNITETIQSSTIDNRSFLLKVIEIIIGGLIGGG